MSRIPVVLAQDIPHIFAMTLFEEYIYWTDWETKSINRAHKTLGINKTMLISTLHRPMDVHIYHPYRQPEGKTHVSFTAAGGSSYVSWSLSDLSFFLLCSLVADHPCQVNNGGCSNLCLLSPGGSYKCACPTNFYLAADGRQCLSNCTASQVCHLCQVHQFANLLYKNISNVKKTLLCSFSLSARMTNAFHSGGSVTLKTTAGTAQTSQQTAVSHG